jgi:Domain of unknown function (DUF4907)
MKIRQKVDGRCVTGLAALILSCCISITMLFAQAPSAPVQPAKSSAQFPNAIANATFSYKVIDAPNHTYCYDVFADGRLMIHQTSIPALPGNEGLKTPEDATKVALLVIEKIKKGEMPPTISTDEMRNLDVIK